MIFVNCSSRPTLLKLTINRPAFSKRIFLYSANNGQVITKWYSSSVAPRSHNWHVLFCMCMWAHGAVCTCMYVSPRGCMYVYVCEPTGLYVRVCMWAHGAVCTCMYVSSRGCMYVYVCEPTGLYVRAWMWAHGAVCTCTNVFALDMCTCVLIRMRLCHVYI